MRAFLIPCVAFCSLALSGCSVVYSVHPLNTNDDLVEEPALVGQWRPADKDELRFCIQKGDHGTYKMIVAETESKPDSDAKPEGDEKSEKDPKVVEAYDLTLVQLENQLFADMVATGQEIDGAKIDGPAGTVYHHVILKLNVTDSDLGFSTLETSSVREANKQGYAPLSYLEIDGGLLLTASTEELRSAVSHYADLLFSDEEHLVRVPENGADDSQCSATPSP